MAASPTRQLIGIGALVAVVGVALYMFWGRLFPEKIDEISARTDLPELTPAKAAPGDWPWWRGPTLDNHSPDAEAPTSWTESDIAWKKPIPGKGHSTPIVVGNKVILTTGVEEGGGKQIVLALDRTSGDQLWQTNVHEGGLMSKHGTNSHASGTPACDGERIFCQFLNSGHQRLTALDLEGHILWQTAVGVHKGGPWGSGPSPALWGSLVIVNGDAPQAGFIAAVHRKTGDIVWLKRRSPTGNGSYGTPLATEFGGKPEVLLSGLDNVTAYDPATGNQLWACDGLSTVSANTPVVADGVVIGSTGAGNAMIAARPDGSQAWRTTRGSEIPYASTPLYLDGNLYYVSRESRATCRDAETGTERWSTRVRGEFWSSPLLVGKRIYIGSREGDVLVFEANTDKYTEVARNKMDAGIYASPIAVGGKLFIRTEQSLYCIGK